MSKMIIVLKCVILSSWVFLQSWFSQRFFHLIMVISILLIIKVKNLCIIFHTIYWNSIFKMHSESHSFLKPALLPVFSSLHCLLPELLQKHSDRPPCLFSHLFFSWVILFRYKSGSVSPLLRTDLYSSNWPSHSEQKPESLQWPAKLCTSVVMFHSISWATIISKSFFSNHHNFTVLPIILSSSCIPGFTFFCPFTLILFLQINIVFGKYQFCYICIQMSPP